MVPANPLKGKVEEFLHPVFPDRRQFSRPDLHNLEPGDKTFHSRALGSTPEQSPRGSEQIRWSSGWEEDVDARGTEEYEPACRSA